MCFSVCEASPRKHLPKWLAAEASRHPAIKRELSMHQRLVTELQQHKRAALEASAHSHPQVQPLSLFACM